MKASRSLLIVTCVACLLLGACQGVWVSYDSEYQASHTKGTVIIGEMSGQQRKAAQSIVNKSAGEAEVHAENGIIQSVITDSPQTSNNTPTVEIQNFFEANEALYLIENFSVSFQLIDQYETIDGGSVYQYQQMHEGIPVHQADIRVSLNKAGAVSLVNSNYVPTVDLPTNLTTKLNPQTAVGAVAKLGYKLLDGFVPELIIYSPNMVGEKGNPFLAWHMTVVNSEFYGTAIIKDSDGSLVTTATNIQTFTYEIRDFGSQVWKKDDIINLKTYESRGKLIPSHASDSDRVSHLREYFGAIEKYYDTNFNYNKFNKIDNHIRIAINFVREESKSPFTTEIDSKDGLSIRLIAFTLRSYENPIDVFAHEFQHMVTADFVELKHSLSTPEPSAIDEAISDFFSAVLDYYGNPWQATAGESVIRDMKNPENSSNPRHMDNFKIPRIWGGNEASYGNGHLNSTIISHALYLLSEGGIGQGKSTPAISVNGIGVETTAQIVFHALSRLNNNAKFTQLRNAMFESCKNLTSRGKFQSENCAEVKNAFAAVGIGNPAEVPISPTQIQPSNWFGMGSNTHMRASNIDQAYQEMAGIGVKFVREDIPWQEIQTGNNSFNLEYRDGALRKALDSADKYKLNVVGILAYSPGKAVTYQDNREFLSHWENYVTKVVQTYGDQIDYWEVGNEVNTWWHKVRPGSKGFEDDVYMNMLAKAYQIIKRANPNDVVIMSSLVNIESQAAGLDPVALLRTLRQYDPEKYSDVLNLHVYWEGQDPDELRTNLINGKAVSLNMGDYVTRVIKEMNALLGRDMPVWITEVGYDQTRLSRLEREYDMDVNMLQSVMMLKSYLTLLSIPEVESVFWYTLLNDETGQQFAMSDDAKATYQTMTMAIGGSRYLGKFDAVDASGKPLSNVTDHRFLRSDGQTIGYYWMTDGKGDLREGHLKPLNTDLVYLYSPNQKFSSAQRVSVTEGANFYLSAIPGLMVGELDTGTRLVVGTMQESKFERASIWLIFRGLNPENEYFYLTYDTSLWNKEESSYTPGDHTLSLIQNPDCKIFSYGDVDGPGISFQSSEKSINSKVFRITTVFGDGAAWRENIETDDGVAISVNLGKNPDTCREFVWDVIELSQKDNFGLSQSKDVTLEVVNMDDIVWLTYAPALWDVDGSRGYNFLSAKDFSGCNIMLNFGHGIDPTVFGFEGEQQQTIGDTIFSVARWFRISSGETVLVGFYFDDFQLSVEGPNAETLPDECISLVYDVIINSEAKGFGR